MYQVLFFGMSKGATSIFFNPIFGENYWSLAVYVSSWIIMDQSFTTL